MPLNNQELALLIWILHFKEQYTLKDIATILKIRYWKVKDFDSAFEKERVLKIENYQKNLVLYKKKLALYESDQERLKSLFWKFLAWVRLWNPLFKPLEPSPPILEPERSPDFNECYERCVKRLERIRKAKGRSKSKITRVNSKSDQVADFLNAFFGKP